MADAVAHDPDYGPERKGKKLLNFLTRKMERSDGTFDAHVGDMYKLDECLGERKFDNILIGFSLFVPKGHGDEKLTDLFKGVRKHINNGGRIIISDVPEFSEDAEEAQHGLSYMFVSAEVAVLSSSSNFLNL